MCGAAATSPTPRFVSPCGVSQPGWFGSFHTPHQSMRGSTLLALVLVAVRAAVAPPRGAHELRVLLRARPPRPSRRLDSRPLVRPERARAGRVEVHLDLARRGRARELVVGIPGVMRVLTRLRAIEPARLVPRVGVWRDQPPQHRHPHRLDAQAPHAVKRRAPPRGSVVDELVVVLHHGDHVRRRGRRSGQREQRRHGGAQAHECPHRKAEHQRFNMGRGGRLRRFPGGCPGRPAFRLAV